MNDNSYAVQAAIDPEFNIVGKPASKTKPDNSLSLADIVEEYTRWYTVPGAETVITEIEELKRAMSEADSTEESRKAHEAELQQLESLAHLTRRLSPAEACRLYRKFTNLGFLKEPMYQRDLGSMPANGLFPLATGEGGERDSCRLRFSGGYRDSYEAIWSPALLGPFFKLDSWPEYPRSRGVLKISTMGALLGFAVGAIIAAFFQLTTSGFVIATVTTSLLFAVVSGLAQLPTTARRRWYLYCMKPAATARFTGVEPESLSQQSHIFLRQFDNVYRVAKVAKWGIGNEVTPGRTVDPGFIIIGQIGDNYWLLATCGLRLAESDILSQTPSLLSPSPGTTG